jgi:hypothetical protein
VPWITALVSADSPVLRYWCVVVVVSLKCAFIEMFCTSGSIMVNNVVGPSRRVRLTFPTVCTATCSDNAYSEHVAYSLDVSLNLA